MSMGTSVYPFLDPISLLNCQRSYSQYSRARPFTTQLVAAPGDHKMPLSPTLAPCIVTRMYLCKQSHRQLAYH